MDLGEALGRVRGLSDGDLLSGLNRLVAASRRGVAEVVAHLGEVEERRLHLLGGHASMFAYCVSQLGMSEDEAYRRIEVARLVRRFPALLVRLASGQVSLSVAALLKTHLKTGRDGELLDAVSGKTVQQAREVLAAWYPQPDVLPSIRKLPVPQRRSSPSPVAQDVVSVAPVLPLDLTTDVRRASPSQPTATPPADAPAELSAMQRARPERPVAGAPFVTATAPASGAPPSADVLGREHSRAATPAAAACRPQRTIEPLSPDRYKVVLTASAELKRKLELARDLLRHAVPTGDLATIIERGLDLLLEQTLKRRFGLKNRPKASRASSAEPRTKPNERPPTSEKDSHGTPPNDFPSAHGTARESAPSSPRARLPNAVRCKVFARDGARCAWEGPDGVRCGSRAWLEYDHVIPWGQGGGNDPHNIRLYCRAHNRLAAEQAYGQNTINRCIARHEARAPNGER